jgi:hypothetical protein
MSNLINLFFGPLDKSACIYFYFLTAFFFVILIISVIFFLMLVIQKPKEINMRMFLDSLLLGFNIFIAYFVNRLLYTMCTKSLA